MRALFMPDDHGMGHFVRCEALAVELEYRGWHTFTIGPREEVPEAAYDLLVIDRHSYLEPVPGFTATLRIIDDPAVQGPCEVLVLGSPGAGEATMLSEKAETVLLGADYALLRTEFAAERKVERDRWGILDVRQIAGFSARDLAEQMASARVVISYAGMRALEAACVGTPTVLVARNRGESLNAHGLADAGAATLTTETEAPAVAQNMLRLPELLGRMGRTALGLVDGRGCVRVADAVEALIR